MKLNQIIVISVSVLLLVLLFILPKQLKLSQVNENTSLTENKDEFSTHLEELINQLDSNSKNLINGLRISINNERNPLLKMNLLDSIIEMGDLYQKPLLGAYYSEEKVKLKADLRNIREAADRYFYSTNNLDEHLKTHMFEKGAEYYNKFLKLDSNDLDAKINLAVCYVESSKEPMKGIGLLREVLEKDSNNIKAHLNLGYFAIKSGQFDKAIGRFEKVLKIEPKNQEALLYLGDVYESQGNIEKAITYYEKYKASLTDKAIAIEVQTYIEKLKNKLQTI